MHITLHKEIEPHYFYRYLGKMYFYRYNIYTKQYYYGELDEQMLASYDVIHDNDLTPIIPENPCECGYCGDIFQSRNKLFQHLGLMNIDIRKLRDKQSDIDINVDVEGIGSEGFFHRLTFVRTLRKHNSECVRKKSKWKRRSRYYRIRLWGSHRMINRGISKRRKQKQRRDLFEIEGFSKLSL
jgi:hypothetical protein